MVEMFLLWTELREGGCQSIHAQEFWIMKSREMLECLLMSIDTPAPGSPQRPWSWDNVKSDKDSRKKAPQLETINQSCELEQTRTWI